MSQGSSRTQERTVEPWKGTFRDAQRPPSSSQQCEHVLLLVFPARILHKRAHPAHRVIEHQHTHPEHQPDRNESREGKHDQQLLLQRQLPPTHGPIHIPPHEGRVLPLELLDGLRSWRRRDGLGRDRGVRLKERAGDLGRSISVDGTAVAARLLFGAKAL